MTQKEQTRLQVLNSLTADHMTTEQAATLMRVSARHTRRILAAYSKEGAAALAHGNRGRRPANATPDPLATDVVVLARTRYAGVNHTHLSELLREREGIDIGRNTLRKILTDAGVNSPRRRRPPKHRVRRQRMPREGMLVQIDGSFHRWLGEDGPQFTLLLAVDDATGCVVNALFCELENTRSYLLLMRDLIRSYGIPLALYSDRHGVFKHTPPSETASAPTQFSRAMGEIGVQLIFARSPQAKGRVERTAGTLQDRLVTELRLAGSTTIDDANRVLNDFLPRFNERFGVPSERTDTAYRVPDPELCLNTVLCLKYRRRVGRDNTVKYRWRTLQLLPDRLDRALPGRRWKCSKHWTAGCQCNTKGVSSPPRKRLRDQVSCAASAHGLYPAVTPTVSSGGRRTMWGQWAHCSKRTDYATLRIATAPQEFARLRLRDPESPPRYRRRDGRPCRRRSARGCPSVGSPGKWAYTEKP